MFSPSLGICIGASSISVVRAQLSANSIQITDTRTLLHEGNPRKVLEDFFAQNDITNNSLVVTGRKFKNLVNTHTIPEPEAIEESVNYLGLNGKYRAIASLGGENFIIYCLNEKGSI